MTAAPFFASASVQPGSCVLPSAADDPKRPLLTKVVHLKPHLRVCFLEKQQPSSSSHGAGRAPTSTLGALRGPPAPRDAQATPPLLATTSCRWRDTASRPVQGAAQGALPGERSLCTVLRLPPSNSAGVGPRSRSALAVPEQRETLGVGAGLFRTPQQTSLRR